MYCVHVCVWYVSCVLCGVCMWRVHVVCVGRFVIFVLRVDFGVCAAGVVCVRVVCVAYGVVWRVLLLLLL